MAGPAALARPWRALRRLPLRVQLVAALVVLLAAVLIGSWLVASSAMQNYLLDQLDARLLRTSTQLTHFGGRGLPIVAPGRQVRGVPDPFQVQVQLQANGQSVWLTTQAGGSGALPAVPSDPPTGHAFTVPATDGSVNWRVLASDLPGQPGTVVVVATNQGEVDVAIGDLSRMYLWIAVGALVVLGVLGYVLVRGSLRPLEEVERTAEAIAVGDLSRRVPVRRPGSEVGRLANAFNTMVERIESAFRASELSEASARNSEERMRRFVADASHELRTPLTSIRGYAELYRQGAATSPQDVAGVLRRVEDQAARMGLLVDDLLLLARLDQQRPLERAPVDLAVLAVDAVHDAHAAAPERTVGLRLPTAPGDQSDGGDEPGGDEPVPVPVLGDQERLRQVIGNLVTNAITHTPLGTSVEVRLRVEPPEVVLEVADSGPGLPPDQAERVFERFFRADPARGRAHGGTGLGLAIVAALVAAHGGRVEVYTAVGVGTTFRVRLPLAT